MAKDYPRHQRVGDQIQRELAGLIRSEVKDPRLESMITVAEVRVTADLSQAKVYVTTLGDHGEQSVEALNRAAGFLRARLGKRLHLRSIPTLLFVYDTTAEEGARLSSLIDAAVESDRHKKKSEKR